MIPRREFKLIVRQNQASNHHKAQISPLPSLLSDDSGDRNLVGEQTYPSGPQITTNLPLRPATLNNKSTQKQNRVLVVSQEKQGYQPAAQYDVNRRSQSVTQQLPRANGLLDPRLLPSWRNFNFSPNPNSTPSPAIGYSGQHSYGNNNSITPVVYPASVFQGQSLLPYQPTFQPQNTKTRNFRRTMHTRHALEENAVEPTPKFPSEEAPSYKDRASRKLPVPTPSASYLAQAEVDRVLDVEDASTVHYPRRLLVVIDLNGTILCRTNRKSSFQRRKNVEKFMAYLLDKHSVMVWSSSRPHNVKDMLSGLLSQAQREKLVTTWARDTLRLTKTQYEHKVQVYKQLSWIWESDIGSQNPDSGLWDQTNTVLIDDSAKKAAAEPYNLVEIPEFNGKDEEIDVLGQVLGHLQWLSLQPNVSNAIRRTPFKANGSWNWTWD
jgi:hypothetical protein